MAVVYTVVYKISVSARIQSKATASQVKAHALNAVPRGQAFRVRVMKISAPATKATSK